MPRLVQPLPPGPLDIIGDVHGELDALVRLLDRLGHDPGQGTGHRHLVFLGDLVDRGPDSPGVIALVRDLIERGLASCVAGNHEYNLLQSDHKEGNGWYFGHHDAFHFLLNGVSELRPFPSVEVQDPFERSAIADFLATLPLALEREDLRIVHACWDEPSLARLPEEGFIGPLGEGFLQELRNELASDGTYLAAERERQRFADLRNPEVRPDQPLPAMQALSLAEQAGNPIKVLTSGREEPIPISETFYVGGKWRVVRRSRWWEDYRQRQAVVVGHYWRRRGVADEGKDDLWEDVSPFGWAGRRGNVFCVDYSAGRRFLERWFERQPFHGGLCAMRWPERTVVFDDWDEPVKTTGFGRTTPPRRNSSGSG